MFDKLRLKLILINMSLLTTVFIAIFVTIYTMTSANINMEIKASLNDLVDIKHKPMKNAINIVAEISKDGQIVKLFQSYGLNIDESILQDTINRVMEKEDSYGKIDISNNNYSYLKQLTPFGNKIAFIDRTPYQRLIFELLKSFILIGSISLIVLLIISIYLTNKSIKPIKETFEKQKQFIADASHELKTPLTIIKTNTSLVLSNLESTVKSQEKWINYISSQVDRMSTLINEMLSLAKLDVNETKLNLTPINTSKIIESMLLIFDAVIYENGINLESEITKNIFINGDQESIKKLFSIIMDNAIKHTNKNGKITVSLLSDKNKIKMIIKNTGEGIPAEHLEKIFERFYRVDSSRVRETGGYGLGLSIASSIVNQHKGKIYAQSKENQYTSFFVEFPQQQIKLNQ